MISRLHLTACLPLSLVLLAVPLARAAEDAKPAEPHFPTTDDLRHLKALGGPQLSPDGKSVLFVVTDATADGAKSHIWFVSSAGGADTLRQLTFSPPADKRGERSPAWAPDGSAIFFLAHRGEHSQLFRLDLRGGEAMPYDMKVMPAVDQSKEKDAIPPPGAEKKDADKKDADKKEADKKADADKEKKPESLAIDVGGFAISADGKWLAVWASDPETPGEKKEKDAKADADWVNHDIHGTRLYLAGLKADGSLDGELKASGVAPNVRNVAWSAASDKLLVVTEPMNDLSDLGPAGQAFVVEADNADKPQKLDAIPPTVGGIAFSPDESTIVFSAKPPEDAPPGYDEFYALPKESSGAKVTSLSSGFMGQLGSGPLYFPPDGSLVAQAGVGTHATPVRLSLDGTKPPAPIDLGAPVVTGLNTNRKKTGWVWLAESGGQPEKLCYAEHLGDACSALPIPELAPANLRSVEPELVKWTSGPLNIEGLLYIPPNAK